MRTVSYLSLFRSWWLPKFIICVDTHPSLGDEDVRADMSDALDRIAPDEGPQGEALYRHECVVT